ncbi:MAG: chemotaxis response regulator protein-glutamate methylesterase [Nocardioidaceae bacterium]
MSRISVLVVDDSVVVRRLVTDVLSSDPRIEVVGTASNGKIALSKMPQLNPDVVTLDIEMPIMDGLETLVHMRKLYPDTPCIMFSTLTERGAHATLDALERGAHDYVTKPANVGSVTASMAAVKADLIPKIEAAAYSRRGGRLAPPVPKTANVAAPPIVAAPRDRRPSNAKVEVVVIGVSTGGPDALTTVISGLPDMPVPIAVVQHMPPIFTALFADRLNTKSPLHVSEAKAGDRLEPGRVLVAPGDYHLRLRQDAFGVSATLDQGTPENYCRPAVDVLFRSAADVYGAGVLAVVLTGMGSDGARGAGRIVEAGGSVIVQDEATSVVWGMPGAVVGAGLADEVLPVRDVAGAIQARVARGRSLIGAKGVARP